MALNSGTGALSITSTGTVTGNLIYGIYAGNSASGTSLTINAATVAGSWKGISAKNSGSGEMSITSTGLVTSNVSHGIDAKNYASGSSLTINTADITAQNYGIFATNQGSGALSITSTGTISALQGILAFNSGTDLTVTTAAVNVRAGGTIAVNVVNNGTGALSITTTGKLVGPHTGIWAENKATGGSMTINSAAIVGGSGITAINRSSNSLVINSNGAVEATVSMGITAMNLNAAANNSITINAGTITAAGNGIDVSHTGNGAITINSTGAITGAGMGILVNNRTNNNAPATINSSAPITGTGGFAIVLRGDANDIVNLRPGSVINGAIDFGNGNDNMGGTNPNDIDTLNADLGFSGVVTFADRSGSDSALESAPENMSENIALINNGQKAVVLDPSGFAAADLFLYVFPNAVFNSIDNGSIATNRGSTSNGFYSFGGSGLEKRYWASGFSERHDVSADSTSRATPGMDSLAVSAREQNVSSSEMTYWVSSFGGDQKIEAGSSNVDLEHDFFGVMIGAESHVSNGILGLFGGYGMSDVDIDFGSGSTDTITIFGGAYLKRDYGTYRINMALVGLCPVFFTKREWKRQLCTQPHRLGHGSLMHIDTSLFVAPYQIQQSGLIGTESNGDIKVCQSSRQSP